MNHRPIPFIYYLLNSLNGIAASFAFYGWYRELSLFFGVHMISRIIIVIAGMLGLGLGSYVVGHLADRLKNPSRTFIILALVTGLFLLFQQNLFHLLQSAYYRTITLHDASPFMAGLIQFIFSFIFLLIPAGLIAGLTPLLIRNFIKAVNSSGFFMSSVILSFSTGGGIGMLSMVYLIIPILGVQAIFIFGSILYFIIPLILFLFSKRKIRKIKDADNPSVLKSIKKTLRFRKKKNILDARSKLTRAMLYASFLQIFTFTSIVFLAYRLLIFYSITTPIYSVMMVFLIVVLAMIMGSSLYKGIADKAANKFLTLATFQLFIGLALLLSFGLLNVVSRIFIQQDIHTIYQGIYVQAILYASLLLFPSLLFGMSFPLSGRLYTKRLQYIAGSFGRLGILMSLCFVISLLITPYILVPLIGLKLSFLFFAFLILSSGVYLIFRDSRLIRLFRLGYGLSALLVFFITAISFRLINVNYLHNDKEKRIEGSSVSVTTNTNPDHSQYLLIDGKVVTGNDRESNKELIMATGIPLILKTDNKIQKALVIGFGSGIAAATLEENGVENIQISEMYREILKLSSDVFADDNNDIMTNSHVQISTESARTILRRTNSKYDLISEVSGYSWKVADLYSKDFYALCRDKLSDQGLFSQVIPITSFTLSQFKSICKANSSIFKYTSLWYINPEKALIISSQKPFNLDYCLLSQAYNAIKNNNITRKMEINNTTSLLGHLLFLNEQFVELYNEVKENTDNHPYLEYHFVLSQKKNEILPFLKENLPEEMKNFTFPAGCYSDTTAMNRQLNSVTRSLLEQKSFSFQAPMGIFEHSYELIN